MVRRIHLSLLAGVAAVSALAVVPASAGATTVAKTPSGSSLASAAKKAILAEHGVHLQVVESQKASKNSEKVVADMGVKTGSQVLTYGSATASVRLTPSFAYFKGNSSGLTTLFGLPSTVVKKINGRWVSLAKGSTQYKGFQQEGTLTGLPTTVLPTGQSTKVTTSTSGGHKVYVLTWTVTPTGTTTKVRDSLLLPTSGNPLPISETGTALDGSGSELVQFSKWGEKINVVAPSSSVAYSKVSA
ncbi:MAG: hypothetical protein JWM85_127 [Acidimicrobiaceae bacterium]|nr:hypothetical protein [Acidimicrobiaceae bacterium]